MSQPSTAVIIFGASGRMGERLCALALADEAITLAGAIVRSDSPRAGETVRGSHGSVITLKTPENQAQSRARADVVIDFSSDEGLRDSSRMAVDARAALVVGTTALSAASLDALKKISTIVPVLVAPNTALGVAALADLVARCSRILGPAYECSIVEAHHSRKKDAPSGTALRLAAAARDAGHALKDDQILALRGGDVVGEHTVRFAGPGEYIELTHRATTRDLFALGALRVAKWIKGKPPGWYTMNDCLNIKA